MKTPSTITLNNLGARLIDDGGFEDAIPYLSAAFQSSKRKFDEIYAQSGQIPTNMDQRSSTVIDAYMTRDVPGDKNQEDFVYTHPIHVPPEATKASELTIVVATTFNLAVAYHMASRVHNAACACNGRDDLQAKINSHQLMRQALRLYQYSFRLQRTQAKSTQSPLFFMACINNIGILFQDLGESTQAAECFNHLLALLMYMSSVGSDDSSYFESFFQNSSRLGNEACTVGAAAA
mmetsp:Transcript_124373/g.175463  ORF Transcript_124373/g.175463 Transcript_124373/m.175463 type:complete len:235 (+) Transcript_124373:55-759(+)